jgi:hypothetical protein
MTSGVRALLLLAGWTLFLNRGPNPLDAPRDDWKKVRKYDTAWLCEEGRRKEAAELAEDAAKDHPDQSETLLAAMLRYRCEPEGRK